MALGYVLMLFRCCTVNLQLRKQPGCWRRWAFRSLVLCQKGTIKIILCDYHSPFILSVLANELSSIAFMIGSWLLAHSWACPLTTFFLQSVWLCVTIVGSITPSRTFSVILQSSCKPGVSKPYQFQFPEILPSSIVALPALVQVVGISWCTLTASMLVSLTSALTPF